MDNLFENIVNISKAGAYDIVSKQVQELQAKNELLRNSLIELAKVAVLTTKDIAAFEGAERLDEAIDKATETLNQTI